MNRIRLDIKKVRFFKPWGRCSLFGEPDLTKAQYALIGDDEIFLAQINLETYRRLKNSPLLPKKGILSFFINTTNMTGIVRYHEYSTFNKNCCLRVDFNSSIDCGYDITSEYRIRFVKNKKTKFESGFLLEDKRHEHLNDDDIILFEYYSKDANYMSDDPCFFCYVIKREHLLNRDYKEAKLVIIRDR